MDKDLIVVMSISGFLITIMIIYLVGEKIAERECLQAGYPNSYNTYVMETYCANIDGTETVKLK